MERLLLLIIKQMSYANNLGCFEQHLISLTYIRKNKGPSMEPCGTPKSFGNVLEDFPFSIKTCCLLKKDLISVRAEPLIP